MSSAKKATIYVDVDDEITALIDKINDTKERIIALVLPKRATMLQSIVNMKLLKRSADDANKKLVLITSEANILPLAGATGLYVAKTLQSKPVIPTVPEEKADDHEEDVEDIEIDKTAPIGALTGEAEDEIETAEIPEEPDDKATDKADKKAKYPKKNKKFKIPNFNKFRLKVILGVVLLLLLIGGWVAAAKILPKAEILVKTNTTSFTKDLSITASPDLASVDSEKEIVPAKVEELQKQDSETSQASGEQNVGKKATGTLTLTNCIDDGKSHTVPKGTSFSKDGKTFLTDKSVELGSAYFYNGECKSSDLPPGFGAVKDVDATAAEGGSDYNIKKGSYASSIAGINAYGSDMKGGTDKVIKIVSQNDIDKAKQQLREKTSEGTVEDLQALLRGQGYVPFESTYEAGEPKVEVSVEAGTEADSVTVTSTTTYKMAGAQKSAIEAIIKQASQEDIDSQLQSVTDSGIDKATIRVSEARPDGTYALSVETIVTAGPEINEQNLLQEILGKKLGETQSIIRGKAGVSDVEVNYSPFWVHSTPNNPDKVTIRFENISEAKNDTQQ